MDQNISLAYYLEFFARIALACGCGAAIGLERSRRLKEAGVRTHLLVACAAALMMIVSKYGFSDFSGSGNASLFGIHGADPSRIAAQVVSGIGFLCAGVIFRQGSMIKGLTTAAGMWATTGVGLALGAGMYLLGIFSTALVVLLQLVTHHLPILNDQYQNSRIEITVENDPAFHSILSRQLNDWKAQIMETNVSHNKDGTTSYSLVVKMNADIPQEEIFAFLEKNSGISSFSRITNG